MLLINKLLLVIIVLLVIILVTQMYMLSKNRIINWEMFYTKPIVGEKGELKYDPNPEHDTVYHKRMDDVISKQELAKIQGDEAVYDSDRLSDLKNRDIDKNKMTEESQKSLKYPESETPLNYRKTGRIEDRQVLDYCPPCPSCPVCDKDDNLKGVERKDMDKEDNRQMDRQVLRGRRMREDDNNEWENTVELSDIQREAKEKNRESEDNMRRYNREVRTRQELINELSTL